MNKTLAALFLLVPSVASAHDGSPHVHGDDPNLLAAVGVFAAVGLAVAALRRFAAKLAKKAVRS